MTTVRRRATVALLCLVVTISLAGPSAAESVVYTLKNRPAAELLEIASAALGEDGSASLDTATNSIVLMGPAASTRNARALLERMDVTRRSVIVRVLSRSTRALRGAGYRVQWTSQPGPFGTGHLIDTNTGDPATHGPPAEARVLSTARDDTFTTSLRILDGEVGRIETGRSVPVTDRRLFGSTTTFVEVSSGLLASPRVLGDDRVQLDVAPYEGDVSPAGRSRVMQTATTVNLRVGEVVVLGTLAKRGSAAGQDAFARRSRDETSDDRVLLISVDID